LKMSEQRVRARQTEKEDTASAPASIRFSRKGSVHSLLIKDSVVQPSTKCESQYRKHNIAIYTSSGKSSSSYTLATRPLHEMMQLARCY
jgi:hypothetical protein